MVLIMSIARDCIPLKSKSYKFIRLKMISANVLEYGFILRIRNMYANYTYTRNK